MYDLMMASASPRRRELIKNITDMLGCGCFCLAVNADETMDSRLSPEDAVVSIAVRKAQAASGLEESRGRLIIAADTIVVLDGVIFGKPKDAEDAKRMLGLLSGREHDVLTGVCLITPKGKSLSFCERTGVRFCDMTQEEIDAYVATGEPLDKAGAYGIQNGGGSLLISGITGDYYNVMGLPVCRIYHELQRLLRLEAR